MNTVSSSKTKIIVGALTLLAASLGVGVDVTDANALPAVQSATGAGAGKISNQQKSNQLKFWSNQHKVILPSNQLKSNLLKGNQLKSIMQKTI